MADPQFVVGGERHYGLKVGDLIEYGPFGTPKRRGKVAELSAWDNNCAFVLFDGNEKPSTVVAEWCVKVSDHEEIT